MRNLKKILKAVAVILIICIMLSSCASSTDFRTGSVIENTVADKKYHLDSEKYETVAKNSFIEMSIDKMNHSLVVKDADIDYKWAALGNENKNAFAFEVTLYTKNGIYKFNSQDNSVAFGSSSYEIKNGIASVTYIMSDNKNTAAKTTEDMTDDDIFVKLPVKYELKNQTVYMSIDFKSVSHTKNAFISEISIMPHFGGNAKNSADDWFLIPDNSGALMHLDKNNDATDNIRVNVYGADPYNNAEAQSASAILPVFGVKRGNSGFVAVITEGDALAAVNAVRNKDFSNIYPSFNITEVSEKSENSVYTGKTYDGRITVAYKFLSGSNVTYTAMASAAREEFIVNSSLSSDKTEITENLPFNLTVVGAENNSILTTTDQATDILGILKGKGISNIVINYNGLYKGGTSASDIYTSSINKKTGGKTGLKNFYDYTQKQGCTLLLGANILSSGKTYLPHKKAYNIASDNMFFSQQNDLGYNKIASSSLLTRIGKEAYNLGQEKINTTVYSPVTAFDMNVMNISSFKNSFTKYLDSDITGHTDGISVTDAGLILYSDDKTTRQDAMNDVSSMLRAVSNYGTLSVSGGNLYSLYNASYITNMLFDTFYPESDAYESVPFAQAVLHGKLHYSGLPIDAGSPLYKYNMLRYIEYGAVPAYEWIYANENVYCYSGYLLSERLSEVVEFYNDASEMLSDIADKTITDHKKITKNSDGENISGVYCTVYSDGTEIYVNYTGSIVTTNDNIAIGPYDYVKVKR